MTKSEQHRIDVLTRLIGKTITTDRASELLGMCPRNVQRLAHRFTTGGVASLTHGNRGKRPHNALSPDQAERIAALTCPGGAYDGFNVCHTQDLLAERDGIVIGRSTLHRMLHPKPAGTVAVEKAIRGIVRRRRLRKEAEGMMEQIDGSPHDWLEGRAPKMCLMGAIDDATGRVTHGHFQANEDALGYLFMFRAIAILYGMPMSFYHDKHTILRSPKKATIEDELLGQVPMSHIQAVMHHLGIQSIAAHSPQAKGRIERLWSTFQDRLVKEMRLAGINTMEQANEFLPIFIETYNSRFAIEAVDPNPAWVALEPGFDLDYYFSIQETRTVKEDHTLSFEGKIFQIRAGSRTRSLAGQKVTVRVNPEGKANLYDGKKRLEYSIVPSRPLKTMPQLPSPANPNSIPADPAAAARKRGWLHASV
ncbi:MAG TPA: ISNCY family transposase [Capsulimonadaceae bacterium]